MAFGKAELEGFLATLDLDDESKKTVLTAIGSNEKALTKFGEHVLRQEDYSKNMNKLKSEEARLKADYEKKLNAENAFHDSLSTWKAGSEKKLNDAIAAREAAEDRLAAVKRKIDEAEVVEKEELSELLKGTVDKHHNEPPPRRDTNDDGKPDPRYLTAEDFKREALHYSKLPALINRLDREYHKLYGAEADEIDWDKVVDEAVAQKRSIQDQVEFQFKLADKRRENDQASIDQRIKDAEKRGEERARSELAAANPGSVSRRSDQPGSVVFDLARKQAEGKLPDQNVNGDKRRVDGVAAAVAAFNSGTYKKTA